ncbi:hypothetical protein JOM56_015098 [Amanita muscaria]
MPSTSPCMRLNDDVLREIFIHEHACFVPDYPKPSIRDLPQLSVSRVCSLWRHIALLTPQLWSEICILDLTEANLRTAREYLSRAENLPVSITLSRTRLPGQWRSQLINFLSSYRIRALIVTEELWFHLILSDLPQRSVADLESLIIFNDIDHEGAQIDLNETRYPKLTVVLICGFYKISSFNSSSLRSFDGRWLSMTLNESWDLLSRCPSLEESHLRITRVNDSRGTVSIPQIHLRRLHILALHSESETDEIPFSTFIEVLTLPVIEELHVFRTTRLAWSATAFQSLARRSNCFPHLRDLVLRNPTSVVDAGALLALVPSLESIDICSDISTSNAFYDHLTLNGLASGSLVPRLQSLIVGYVSNGGLFVDMVESRMKNAQTSNGVPAPFTRVQFFADDQGYHDHCDRLLVNNRW